MLNNLKSKIGSVAIGVGVIVIGGLGLSCLTKINPGMVGVKYNWSGGVEDTVLQQGINIVPFWKKVTEYPVSTEVVYYMKSDEEGKDSSINVNTKDGKQVNVSVTYSFHMDSEKLPEIFTKFRGQNTQQIEQGYMRNEMFQAINEVTSQYNLMELVGSSRPIINSQIFEKFHNSLEPYGIIIETFNLSDVVPDEQTKEAIQRVVNSQNALEQAKIEKEKAQVEADKRIIEAESVARANQIIQESLTDNLIKKQALERWDGKLPQIYSGSSSGILFNIPEIK